MRTEARRISNHLLDDFFGYLVANVFQILASV